MTRATKSGSSAGGAIDEVESNPITPMSSFDMSHLQITVHKLNGKNYFAWAQFVKLIIDGKGKLGYLNGEEQKPAANDPKVTLWRSKNSMIIVWLINSMKKGIGRPFLYMPTVKDVWDVV